MLPLRYAALAIRVTSAFADLITASECPILDAPTVISMPHISWTSPRKKRLCSSAVELCSSGANAAHAADDPMGRRLRREDG
eukprot:6190679-Pleurochrysis_carterae.AAC.2